MSAVGYAVDTFLPLVDLNVAERCAMALPGKFAWSELAEGLRLTYALIGLVFVSLATLTFAGVLRRD